MHAFAWRGLTRCRPTRTRHYLVAGETGCRSSTPRVHRGGSSDPALLSRENTDAELRPKGHLPLYLAMETAADLSCESDLCFDMFNEFQPDAKHFISCKGTRTVAGPLTYIWLRDAAFELIQKPSYSFHKVTGRYNICGRSER